MSAVTCGEFLFPVSESTPEGTSTASLNAFDLLINVIADACGSLISQEIPVPKIPSTIKSNLSKLLRKKQETEARINLDKSKLLQARDLTEQKLEQNEDLAELRADTSLVKQEMSNQAKMRSDVMKRKDVKTLKGPRE